MMLAFFKAKIHEALDLFIAYLLRLSKARSRAGLYEFLDMECSRIAKGMKVLTVGSGGDVNKVLYKYSEVKCFEVVSLDIDKNRSPDILGDICTESLGFSCLDVVFLCEVLEHVHSPSQALENIYVALKPGGKLILSVPFALPMHDRPNDFFRFTRYGLKLLLSKFSEVSIEERNTYFEAIDVIWMRLIIEKKSILSYIILPTIYFLKRPLTLLLNKILISDGITTGYVVTAVKRV